jgi:hypothetical protein
MVPMHELPVGQLRPAIPGVAKKAVFERRPLCCYSIASILLLDDLDDAVGSRVDQHGAAIHDGVSVLAHAIFRRHIVIGDTLIGEHRPNPYIFVVLIGRAPLFDHIGTEARPLIDPKDAGYSANDAADHATNDGPDGTRRPFPISCASFNAARDALGLACNGKHCGDRDSGGPDKTADHDDSLIQGR